MSNRHAPKLYALYVPVLLTAASLNVAGASAVVTPGTERAFAASYTLSHIENDGATVRLTMTLTLQNPGNRDIHGGIVAVLGAPSQPDPDRQPALLTSFAPIKDLPHLQRTTITRTFTVPAAEFARWNSGHEPVLEFLVPGKDASGEDTALAEGIASYRDYIPGETP